MSKRIYKGITAVVLCALLLMTQVIGIIPAAQDAQAAPGDYFSPFDVAYSPDGTKIAASDSTKAKVEIINAAGGTVTYTVALNGTPKCVAWKDNTTVYVAEYGARTVAAVNSTNGTVTSRFNVGPKPFGLAYVSATSKLYVTDFGLKDVRVVDVTTGNTTATVALPDNYPAYITLTPANDYAIVGYTSPTGNATQNTYASRVSFILLSNNTVATNIALPYGSTSVRAIKCSPNGTWAYVAHTYGRTTMPTTQLTKGWVYTNAISVIKLSDRTYYTTFLLDRISEGFANPWGVACDNNTLWVSSSGCNQIAKIDMVLLNQLMNGVIPAAYITSGANLSLPNPLQRKKFKYTRPFSDVWFYVKQNGANRSLLKDDLSALWGAGVMTIIRLEANANPRGIALSPDGTRLAIAGYMTGKVYTLNTSTNAIAQSIAVGAQPADDQGRRGLKLYWNATDSQQHWISCTSCHPDGRPDGLNWDLLNDGVGNPKNAKSHLNSHMTAPSMAHGIRKDYTVAVNAGYLYLKFVIPTQAQLDDCAAAMRQFVVEPDPYRNADGTMTADAIAGKTLFDSNCRSCHSGPLMTDYQMHTTTYTDSLDTNQSYDTPSLIECWRTAPYLHNGSQATIKDAMNALGYGSSLTDTQKNQVVAYVQQFGANSNALGNIAPYVSAGYDWVHSAGGTYNVSSAACVDDGLPGTTLNYTWSKTSGPACSFDNVNLLNPTVTFSGGAGTYVLQIQASDTALNSTDTCTIIVCNPTPTPSPRVNIAIGKTASADASHASFAASKAIDGNTSTFWNAGNSSNGHWLRVDLGSSMLVTGTQLIFDEETFAYAYRIQTSTDGTNWTNQAEITSNDRRKPGQVRTDNFSTTTRYVRATLLDLNPELSTAIRWAAIREFRIFDNSIPQPTPTATSLPPATPTPTPRNNVAQGKTMTYDSQQSGNEATKAVDANEATRWCANDGNLNHWIKVDLASSMALTGSQIYWESSGYNYKYKVESSTDNTNWTMRADQTAYSGTEQLRTDNWTGSARYVRLTVTGLASGRWASCWEFRVFNN